MAARARRQDAGASKHNLSFVGLPLGQPQQRWRAARRTRRLYDAAVREFRRAVDHKPDYLPDCRALLAAYLEGEERRGDLEAAQKAEGLHPLAHLLRRTGLPEDEEEIAALREAPEAAVPLATAQRDHAATGHIGTEVLKWTPLGWSGQPC